jgi:hypothetical protein
LKTKKPITIQPLEPNGHVAKCPLANIPIVLASCGCGIICDPAHPGVVIGAYGKRQQDSQAFRAKAERDGEAAREKAERQLDEAWAAAKVPVRTFGVELSEVIASWKQNRDDDRKRAKELETHVGLLRGSLQGLLEGAQVVLEATTPTKDSTPTLDQRIRALHIQASTMRTAKRTRKPYDALLLATIVAEINFLELTEELQRRGSNADR